ncbi:hypothetical protein SAMN04244573_02007 [Azotobacter beijerinckii]|uniref:Molecular chaperone n=1 Tax=Azotobacter beijerinckii TaxID=170623 RepID=A0A1H9HVC8_9GAMM|nr:hypothetical protein [Azotobacter beijerinckii]SEQ66309.1 hypothetical protein SAMN04244573_02007 [Azotobacter beijerinckii]
MNRERSRALLRVPCPDHPGLSFCQATPWALERWIAELPKANLGACAQRLYQGLLELVRLQTSAENRLHLLELLRPEVRFVCKHLERRFLHPGSVPDERLGKVANLCQALNYQLAIGYQQVVALAAPDPAEQAARQVQATAIQRALQALHDMLIRTKRLHRPPRPGLWLEMHSLYRTARDRELLRLPVDDRPTAHPVPATIERSYAASLLLGTARCNQMSRLDITRLSRALESWSALVRLQEEAGACPLLVDLARDRPPRYRRLCDPDAMRVPLGIDPGALLGVLEIYLQEEKDARHSLPPPPGGLGMELLEHLYRAWGDLAQRAGPRALGDGRLAVVLGLGAVHYHLADRRPFDEVLQRPRDSCQVRFQANRGDLEDVWNRAVGVRSLARQERAPDLEAIRFERPATGRPASSGEPAGEEPYPVFALSIVDRSPGGYGLLWPDAPASLLQAGELIGVLPASGQGWAVGVVRWVRQGRNGAHLGIELIAERAESCGVRLVDGAPPNGQYLRALLLSASEACPASLITAGIPFREDSRVWINQGGEERLAVLTQRLAAAGRFSRFEYHLSGQGGAGGWTLL